MPVTPPSFINVGGKRITINILPPEKLPGRYGEYDPGLRCINLSSDILESRQLFRDTLVHEVIHCAFDLAGLSFNTSGALTERKEEQVVTAVETLAAPAIIRVWRI